MTLNDFDRNKRKYNRGYRRNPHRNQRTLKKFIITVHDEPDNDKKEEMVLSHAIDAMFAIEQGLDRLILRSQGSAINVCADLVLEIDRRLENQMIPVHREIRISSRIPHQRNRPRSRYDFSDIKIISYFDVTYYFDRKNLP